MWLLVQVGVSYNCSHKSNIGKILVAGVHPGVLGVNVVTGEPTLSTTEEVLEQHFRNQKGTVLEIFL